MGFTRAVNTRCLLWLTLVCLTVRLGAAQVYPDRFVWIFGWGLSKESDVAEISRVVENAGKHGCNGAVVSFGLDTLSRKPADYLRRLGEVRHLCEQNRLEVIPAVFSVGHAAGFLVHDANLAEGLPVENAPFLVRGGEACLAPDNQVQLSNGGFEEFSGHRVRGLSGQDQPGQVSFVDHEVRHTGRSSLRLENFQSSPDGNARVMQAVSVHPHRSYRASVWVKTENLQPVTAFRLVCRAGSQELAPREFRPPSTADWRKLTLLFNSLAYEKVQLGAGLWGATAGKVWLDDWGLEEVGPVNVLNRPGTPVTVRSEDGKVIYAEGSDYAPLRSLQPYPWRDDGEPLPLKLSIHSRIRDGERLRVSWYHSLILNESQVTVCMAEPALYRIMDQEAKVLARVLHPRRVMLNMDEVRMGGSCQACRGRDMGELLGECVTQEAATIRRYLPKAQIYVWSDMFDPGHNAHPKYCLVEGDFHCASEHVPTNLVMSVWGSQPREQSLRFFAERGFQTLVACYYDADNLDEVQRWLELARQMPNVRGLMYTPWQRKYDLLPAFGDLLLARPR